MDIRGDQLYIKVNDEFIDRYFHFRWNLEEFAKLNINEIYFRNDDFDKPIKIYTNPRDIKDYGLSYIEFNNGLMVRSNNRLIK